MTKYNILKDKIQIPNNYIEYSKYSLTLTLICSNHTQYQSSPFLVSGMTLDLVLVFGYASIPISYLTFV